MRVLDQAFGGGDQIRNCERTPALVAVFDEENSWKRSLHTTLISFILVPPSDGENFWRMNFGIRFFISVCLKQLDGEISQKWSQYDIGLVATWRNSQKLNGIILGWLLLLALEILRN